ncbi:MAG: Gfo/Idh/MocA family oxidoreductase, partial [Chloroflexota bacterium]|nr:Gfo/Idh/MocA family oxidoreductase [Chloroflexota bacterium]
LSTAHINQALIPPLRISPRNRLEGVASRSQAQADAYAQAWGIPRAFGSYQAMLDDPGIDVVYISVPNHLHCEWTIKAAQAGKHVLCEKPLALNVDEADAMAATARKAGVVLAEAFMYRHHPQTLMVKELVDAGAIGKLLHIQGAYTFPLPPEGYIRLDASMGGGSIWDTGCYPISFGRYVAGAEPLEAFGWQVLGPTGVDETFVGNLRFPGDVFLQFDSGFHTPWRPRFELAGSEAILTVLQHPYNPGFNCGIRLIRKDREEIIKPPEQLNYLGEVEDMADAILLGKEPRISLEFSRGNIAAINALLRSAREGCTVSV